SFAGMSCVVSHEGSICRVEGETRGADACRTPSVDSCTLLMKTANQPENTEGPLAIAAYLYGYGKLPRDFRPARQACERDCDLGEAVKAMLTGAAVFKGAAFTVGTGAHNLSLGPFQ